MQPQPAPESPANPPEPALLETLGPAYASFGPERRQRHIALLQAVQKPQDAALDVAEIGPQTWEATICAADCAGFLTTVAGLFTAHGLDIIRVDAFTVRYPEPPAPSARPFRRRGYPPARPLASNNPAPTRKVLDIFEVKAIAPPPPDLWPQFEADLRELIGLLAEGKPAAAQEHVINRVSQLARQNGAAAPQLLPITARISNEESEESPEFTQLHLHGADTPGFLFAFTIALALLKVNIERAEIRTENGSVHDTFWLTDERGAKLTAPRRLRDLQAAAALIKHFTHLLPRSANPALALRQFYALIQQLLSRPEWTERLRDLESLDTLETLANLMGVSQFLWEDFLRMQHENLFPVLTDTPGLGEARSRAALAHSLQEHLAPCQSRDERVKELNRFKDREMFRIDLRHITGRIDFRRFSEELTDLAEVVAAEAAALAHSALLPRFGSPTLAGDRPCPWSVCALGKFGGRELGFGSDIELLFIYGDQGQTSGAAPVENSRYFSEFVPEFLRCITSHREGVFEIDLRLRPYGNPGPLASSLAGFAEYYSASGGARPFERLALVKLRPVAGDPALGDEIVKLRDAWVYSGAPLDVENILHLRQRQATELVPSGQRNAKYSAGGLVDIEYYTQACQIVAGHASPDARQPNTLDAIAALEAAGVLKPVQAAELRELYAFQRRLIDALRVVRGHAKDLSIPPTESREFAYLTHRLGFASPAALEEAIARNMRAAQRLWERGAPLAT